MHTVTNAITTLIVCIAAYDEELSQIFLVIKVNYVNTKSIGQQHLSSPAISLAVEKIFIDRMTIIAIPLEIYS